MQQSTVPVMTTAKLERAPSPPPAPPPPRSGGGNGKGGGDNDGRNRVFLRMLGSKEQANLLDDWASRTRIYRMSGMFGNTDLAEKHGQALESIEALRAFNISDTSIPVQRSILALCDSTKNVLAIASTVASRKTGLLVDHVAIDPAELNKKDSPILGSMCLFLSTLSQEMKLPFVLSQDVKERVGYVEEDEEDEDWEEDWEDDEWLDDDAECWIDDDDDESDTIYESDTIFYPVRNEVLNVVHPDDF